MGFNLVSKNNMGIVITLILVILLSVSRFFNFLTETPLGRIVLLAFVILISYTHKMLGLLAVLFIIIAFNQYDSNTVYAYNYYEGFDVSGNTVDGSGNIANSIIQDKVNVLKAKEDLLKDKLSAIQQNSANASQTATTTSSAATTTTESFTGGREGFGMTDRESNMLRGKPSNSIPVFNNSREQSDDVSPSDKSVFSSGYASF
jgi:hypothetical protein